MSLSYEPLWQMLNNMNISKMEFAKMIGMSNATLAKLSKNEPITLTTVDKICNQFNCPIEYVVKHIQNSHNIESIFSIGSIVLANNLTNIETDDFLRIRKRPYVILKRLNIDEENNSEQVLYKIAPISKISKIHENDFSIHFENVDIDGKPTSGYILLKNILDISSKKFEREIGIMPPQYMQKISKQI